MKDLLKDPETARVFWFYLAQLKVEDSVCKNMKPTAFLLDVAGFSSVTSKLRTTLFNRIKSYKKGKLTATELEIQQLKSHLSNTAPLHFEEEDDEEAGTSVRATVQREKKKKSPSSARKEKKSGGNEPVKKGSPTRSSPRTSPSRNSIRASPSRSSARGSPSRSSSRGSTTLRKLRSNNNEELTAPLLGKGELPGSIFASLPGTKPPEAQKKEAKANPKESIKRVSLDFPLEDTKPTTELPETISSSAEVGGAAVVVSEAKKRKKQSPPQSLPPPPPPPPAKKQRVSKTIKKKQAAPAAPSQASRRGNGAKGWHRCSFSAKETALLIQGIQSYGWGEWNKIAFTLVKSRTARAIATFANKSLTEYMPQVASATTVEPIQEDSSSFPFEGASSMQGQGVHQVRDSMSEEPGGDEDDSSDDESVVRPYIGSTSDELLF